MEVKVLVFGEHFYFDVIRRLGSLNNVRAILHKSGHPTGESILRNVAYVNLRVLNGRVALVHLVSIWTQKTQYISFR